jgi:hypothetical protein
MFGQSRIVTRPLTLRLAPDPWTDACSRDYVRENPTCIRHLGYTIKPRPRNEVGKRDKHPTSVFHDTTAVSFKKHLERVHT